MNFGRQNAFLALGKGLKALLMAVNFWKSTLTRVTSALGCKNGLKQPYCLKYANYQIYKRFLCPRGFRGTTNCSGEG
jgi:hypothetical protein